MEAIDSSAKPVEADWKTVEAVLAAYTSDATKPDMYSTCIAEEVGLHQAEESGRRGGNFVPNTDCSSSPVRRLTPHSRYVRTMFRGPGPQPLRTRSWELMELSPKYSHWSAETFCHKVCYITHDCRKGG
jgi:hypothetical protein